MNGQPGPGRPGDDRFEQSLRDLLRDSERGIDFVSSSRLSAARARAVDAARRPGRSLAGWWTVPGALLSAVVLAWVLVPGHLISSGGGAAPVPQVEVIETLADDKTTGVYDDLEFYQWLADTDGHG